MVQVGKTKCSLFLKKKTKAEIKVRVDKILQGFEKRPQLISKFLCYAVHPPFIISTWTNQWCVGKPELQEKKL